MTKYVTRLLRLPDGRMLEYAIYGDPYGKTVLYFHGFLGSCHQAALADEYAKTYGFRFVAVNRPGIGRSTPHIFSSMTAYAEDIRVLLDALHVEKAAIIGVSSGGGFALACTYAMPDRVQLTGVAGCIGPLNTLRNLQKMPLVRRVFLSGCNEHPRVIAWLLRIVFVVCKYRPQWLYQWLVRTSCLLESGVNLTPERVKQILWNDYQDVFLQKNGVRGLQQEARLFFHWGYPCDDFPADKRVLFWHGKSDSLVPWSVARELTRHIPRADVVLFPGGHMTFLTKIETILCRVHDVWEDAPEKDTALPQAFLQQTATYPVWDFA